MRICYLAPANSVHTRKWVGYFSRKGHDVHLVSFHPGEAEGCKVYHFRSSRKFCYLLYVPLIKALVRKIKPQIIHAHYVSSYGLVGACLGFRPFLISAWGSDVVDFPRRSWLHRWLVRYSLRQADMITATSRMLSGTLSGLAPQNGKVFVVPFGVDSDRFSPGEDRIRNKSVTIGIVKTLSQKYGVEYLIRAFALVRRKHEKVKLVIVGDGPLRADFENLCSELGCSQDIRFVGGVPNEEVPEYLRAMDIFVVPSVMESETFGVAAVEAQSCGLPVVASKVGGLPEVVLDGKTGLIVPPKDSASLAEAIGLLIEKPELRERLGNQGRRFVLKNYQWIDNAARMERLYEASLGSSS